MSIIGYPMEMTRKKKPLNIYADPDIVADLEAWIKAQEAPWNKTAVIELALKEFLERRKNVQN